MTGVLPNTQWNYNEYYDPCQASVTSSDGIPVPVDVPVLLSEMGCVFVNSFVSDRNSSYRGWDSDEEKVAKFRKTSAINGVPPYRDTDEVGDELCPPSEFAHMQDAIVCAMRGVWM